MPKLRGRRAVRAASFVTAAACVLFGCQSGNGATSPPDTAAAPSTSAREPAAPSSLSPDDENGASGETTSSEPALFEGSVDLTDRDGYTYRIDYRLGAFGAAEKSVTDDKPGYASLDMTYSAELWVTNTTQGRNAPASVVASPRLGGLYRTDRPACAEQVPLYRVDVKAPSGTYCWTRLATGSFAADTLAPDEKTLALSDTQRIHQAGVRESAFDALATDLSKGPDIFVLAVSSGPDDSSGLAHDPGCHLDDEYNIESFSWVLTASPKPLTTCSDA